MGRALTFHPYPRHRIPNLPNCDLDAPRLAREAQARGEDVAAYAARLLAYRWPDGSPAWTVADAVEANGASPPAPAVAPTRRKKP